MVRASVMAFLVALWGCSGSTEQAGTTTPEGEQPSQDQPATTEAPAATGWESLDHEQRAALMREQVMPRMGTIFREFDGDEFATFTCATCHGENFQEVNFHMPNGLAPLVPAQIPTLAESDDEEIANFARFMFGQVTPAMVEILGVAPYDPETHQGFGCLNCHARAEGGGK